MKPSCCGSATGCHRRQVRAGIGPEPRGTGTDPTGNLALPVRPARGRDRAGPLINSQRGGKQGLVGADARPDGRSLSRQLRSRMCTPVAWSRQNRDTRRLPGAWRRIQRQTMSQRSWRSRNRPPLGAYAQSIHRVVRGASAAESPRYQLWINHCIENGLTRTLHVCSRAYALCRWISGVVRQRTAASVQRSARKSAHARAGS